MVVPPWYELPPQGYGGLETIVAALVDGLVERGHHVTLFGAGRRTGTRAAFVGTVAEPQYPRLGQVMPEVLHIARVNALLRDGDFDVVHDHTTAGPATARSRPAPTVVTVHHAPDREFGEYLAALGDQVDLVAISRAQRRLRPELNWVSTVHNAIRVGDFAGPRTGGGPVLWLARFSPDKGPDLAIEACRRAGLPLVLVGKCMERAEVRYLDEVIRPMLGDDVELIVNADRSTCRELLSRARCLVLPIRWNEPFGMVMIEAMAAGTPVVALRRGAVPEVVRHGVTGFVCDDLDELAQALLDVTDLEPRACVDHVTRHFAADLMVRRYERVYRAAIGRARPTRRTTVDDVLSAPSPIGQAQPAVGP
ncbi:MAG TPA: glycosyltransferase family 4 protein [Micromonosporaceae bacterium]